LNKYKLYAPLAATFLLNIATHAQPDKLGTWEVANIHYQFTAHLSFFAEFQVRSQRVVTDFFYHEVKAGAGYSIGKKISFLVAAGDYRTYEFPGNFKTLQTKEFRIWQQFSFKSNLEPVHIDHRFRIEQRWLNSDYRNRFRYRINPVVPINNKAIVPKTLYGTIFDEVFFTDQPPYFERNRFFAGLGYQFSKLFAMQSGFLRQFDYRKSDDGTGKNFIQISLLFTIYRKETDAQQHPLID
jgi:hypothetical protein